MIKSKKPNIIAIILTDWWGSLTFWIVKKDFGT